MPGVLRRAMIRKVPQRWPLPLKVPQTCITNTHQHHWINTTPEFPINWKYVTHNKSKNECFWVLFKTFDTSDGIITNIMSYQWHSHAGGKKILAVLFRTTKNGESTLAFDWNLNDNKNNVLEKNYRNYKIAIAEANAVISEVTSRAKCL